MNCNNLVQEGIHGAHITDVFSEIYDECNQELEPVESAVILLDEFDKLFLKGEFNERVLNELLNIIDDNNSVSFSTGMLTSERVSTKNMLFIFSGVFNGIEEVVRKRLGANAIGFAQSGVVGMEGDFHKYVEESDFSAFFHRAVYSFSLRIISRPSASPSGSVSFLPFRALQSASRGQ